MMMLIGWFSFLGGIFFGYLVSCFFRKCIHDWEPVVERELPSKAEELKKNGENISVGWTANQLMVIASKTFFAVVSCKKCGGIKEFQIKT